MLKNFVKSLRSKLVQNNFNISEITIIIILVTFGGATYVYASTSPYEDLAYNILDRILLKPLLTPIPTAQPSPLPAETATPTPSSTPYPTVKPVAAKKTTTVVDQDPPVHCAIHQKCGGGTKPLKKSECDNSICCFYPDGARLVTKQECNGSPSTPIQDSTAVKNQIDNTGSVNTYKVPAYTPYPVVITQPQPTSSGLSDQQKLELASVCYGEARRTYDEALRNLYNLSRARNNMGSSEFENAKQDLAKQQSSAVAYCKLKYNQP